jgi:hypothetical protein
MDIQTVRRGSAGCRLVFSDERSLCADESGIIAAGSAA